MKNLGYILVAIGFVIMGIALPNLLKNMPPLSMFFSGFIPSFLGFIVVPSLPIFIGIALIKRASGSQTLKQVVESSRSYVNPVQIAMPLQVRAPISNPISNTTQAPNQLIEQHATDQVAFANVTTPAQSVNQILTPAPLTLDMSTEEDFWATALNELETGQRRPGVWAKAFAECDGDETKSKVAYLKARVLQLTEAAKAMAAQQEADHLEAIEITRRAASAIEQETKRLESIERVKQGAAKLAAAQDAALLEAALDGNWSAAKSLLESGVKPTRWNEAGKSLLDIATLRKDTGMISLLRSYGAT